MKIILKLTILILLLQLCVCSKTPLPELDLQEYGADALLELIYDHLDQYTGHMPGDLHLKYVIKPSYLHEMGDKSVMLFSYQVGLIFDIMDGRMFLLPSNLQQSFLFWGGTHDEAVQELYRHIGSIDFSEEGKMPLPRVSRLHTAIDSDNANVISSIDSSLDANSTSALL